MNTKHVKQKGPLQLQNLDQSLAGDVVFAAEAYSEYQPVGLLTQRIMEGEGGRGDFGGYTRENCLYF